MQHLTSKAGSLISGKSPSPVFKWNGSEYKEFTDKLGNIAFIIEGDSSAIMKAILHSLAVIINCCSIWKQVMEIYR